MGASVEIRDMHPLFYGGLVWPRAPLIFDSQESCCISFRKIHESKYLAMFIITSSWIIRGKTGV